MKTYFADTNIFLRFILNDNKKLASQARKYFTQAKNRKINLVFTSEVILEINYVLKKVYGVSKKEIIEHLSTLVKTPYLDIRSREILIKTLGIYQQINVDFVDILLAVTAYSENAEIFSFDKDFKAIAKTLQKN
ncbi:PIN domain-containing protein [Patescibacteria group bacterium]|nr:PIN domain-containing protein [Patescibacteria group bacterium]